MIRIADALAFFLSHKRERAHAGLPSSLRKLQKEGTIVCWLFTTNKQGCKNSRTHDCSELVENRIST